VLDLEELVWHWLLEEQVRRSQMQLSNSLTSAVGVKARFWSVEGV
jgi:hypothetical protein